MNSTTEKLIFNYENSATASYLVALIDENVRIKQFQVEMIAVNSIKGILPVDIRYKDNKAYLYYDITSKQLISQFLSRKKLSKSELTGILSDIISILMRSSNYLLSEKGFLLFENYIYINPLSKEIYLTYLPFDAEVDQIQNFRDLVINIIVHLATLDESGTDNILQNILTAVRQANFNLTDFEKLLLQLKEVEPGSSEIHIMPEKAQVQKSDRPKPQILKSDEAKKGSSNSRAKLDLKLQIPGRTTIPTDISEGKKKQAHVIESKIIKHESTKKETKANLKNILLAAAFLQILVVIGVILVAGYLKQVTQDSVAAYGGTGIILFSVDFLLLRKIFEKYNIASNKDNIEIKDSPSNQYVFSDKLKSNPDMGKREIRNEPEKNNSTSDIFAALDPESQNIEDSAVEFQSNIYMNSTGVADETALLDVKMLKYPQLLRRSDGMVESINISKPNFILGRLCEQVDYVLENNSVGKVHAEISDRNGQYFLKDLNSKNGTYLNGNRIPSNKEQLLSNNDKITFANAEYIFLVMGN